MPIRCRLCLSIAHQVRDCLECHGRGKELNNNRGRKTGVDEARKRRDLELDDGVHESSKSKSEENRTPPITHPREQQASQVWMLPRAEHPTSFHALMVPEKHQDGTQPTTSQPGNVEASLAISQLADATVTSPTSVVGNLLPAPKRRN